MAHSSYLTSIPIIERLIECICPIEHIAHISYSCSYNSISRISIRCNFCLNIKFISSHIIFLSFKQIFFTSFSTVCSFDCYSIGVSIDRVCTAGFTTIQSHIYKVSFFCGPFCPITVRLVFPEERCIYKDISEILIGDWSDIPIIKWLIKWICSIKHLGHHDCTIQFPLI